MHTVMISDPKMAFLIPGPEVIQVFFMLNSTEQEIFPAHLC